MRLNKQQYITNSTMWKRAKQYHKESLIQLYQKALLKGLLKLEAKQEVLRSEPVTCKKWSTYRWVSARNAMELRLSCIDPSIFDNTGDEIGYNLAQTHLNVSNNNFF